MLIRTTKEPQDEWWTSVRDALDGLDPEQVASLRNETRELDATASDGLDEQQLEAVDDALRNALAL